MPRSKAQVPDMGRINSGVDGGEETDPRRRQPPSATAGSVPARPGAYRVESRAPNRQRRGRARSGHPDDVGAQGNGFGGGHVVEAECTATDASGAQPHADVTASAQISLPASRVDEGQTQVVEALHTVVIEDGDGNISANNRSLQQQQQHTNRDRIRKRDWIIVVTAILVTLIVVIVTLVVLRGRER